MIKLLVTKSHKMRKTYVAQLNKVVSAKVYTHVFKSMHILLYKEANKGTSFDSTYPSFWTIQLLMNSKS